MFYIILLTDFEDLSIFNFFEDLSIFNFIFKNYITKMGTRTRIRIKLAMIQTKICNIRIQFKILILKIRNPNRLTEFEQIYECSPLEKDIKQIS